MSSPRAESNGSPDVVVRFTDVEDKGDRVDVTDEPSQATDAQSEPQPKRESMGSKSDSAPSHDSFHLLIPCIHPFS